MIQPTCLSWKLGNSKTFRTHEVCVFSALSLLEISFSFFFIYWCSVTVLPPFSPLLTPMKFSFHHTVLFCFVFLKQSNKNKPLSHGQPCFSAGITISLHWPPLTLRSLWFSSHTTCVSVLLTSLHLLIILELKQGPFPSDSQTFGRSPHIYRSLYFLSLI